MDKHTIPNLRNWLSRNRAILPFIAENSGVTTQTLRNIITGRINNPQWKTLRGIYATKDKIEKAQTNGRTNNGKR